MRDGLNFTIVAAEECIEGVLTTAFKFVLAKMTQTKSQPS